MFMKKIVKAVRILPLFLILILASTSDARVGRGGSSGFRGSRGLAPSRSYQSNPSRNYRTSPNNQQSAPAAPLPGSPSRGNFMRNMLGGIAGGFIGSMLFRSIGYGGMGMPGGGGFGLIEILLLAALGFFLFRFFTKKKALNQNTYSQSAYENSTGPDLGADQLMQRARAMRQSDDLDLNGEQDHTEILQRSDTGFDLNHFKEERTDEFLRIQSAWNLRDLNQVQNLIAPELKDILNSDIENLKKSRQINKLENIAVRGSDLTDSWQEDGKEYATLRFRAQLLDYTINEDSETVISGNRNEPIKFQEEWTFVRNIHDGNAPWKLTAITND
jgi:predicted lipid-binding transport protein (Tim44 family)